MSQDRKLKTRKVKFDQRLVDSSLKYMTHIGRSWENIDRSFIHLYMYFFKNDKPYKENELATEIKNYVKRENLNIDLIKKHLKILLDNNVLEDKSSKGVKKYQLSNMGKSMIINDLTLDGLFSLFVVDDNGDIEINKMQENNNTVKIAENKPNSIQHESNKTLLP